MKVKVLVTAATIVLGLITVAGPAHAQGDGVGAIAGLATDSSGASVPGVTITLTADANTVGGVQETVSDQRGAYQFLRLVPGSYKVRGQLPGFQTVELAAVIVRADATSRADLRLEVGALEETITISGQTPLLDTRAVVRRVSISTEELQELPNRTDVWSIARVAPGIIVDRIDVGGVDRYLFATTSVRGSSTENKFMIDGMDVGGTSGTGNLPVLYFDPFAYEETNFQAGANSAEHAIGGLSIGMVTKSGTNQFRGGAMGNYTPPAWANSQNYSDAVKRDLMVAIPARVLAARPDIEPRSDIVLMRDYGGWLGGPIMRDRLWFVSTWTDQRMTNYYLGSYDADGGPVPNDNVMWTMTNKLSWQATRGTHLSYFHNLQYKLIGHRGGGTFGDERARTYNYKYPAANQVKFTSTLSPRVLADVGYSRLRVTDIHGKRPEVNPGDIARFDTVLQTTTVALPLYENFYSDKDAIKASLSWVQSGHEVKTGYEFTRSSRGGKQWSMSGLRALYANGVPTAVNTYLLPVSTETKTDPENIEQWYDWIEHTHGLFIQDRWTPHSKLALNMGVRFEHSGNSMPATCRPDTVFAPGACYDAITAPTLSGFVPRFNIVYDINGDGRTALKFAANRYNQQVGVSMVQRLSNVSGNISDQRQWRAQSECNIPGVLGCDRNGDLIPQLTELGPSPGFVLPAVNARYADDIKWPVSNEYSVELQRELLRNTVASVGYVHRQTRRNIGSQNTAVPLEAWGAPITVTEVNSGEVVQVWRRPSTASANLFYNHPDFDTNYHGVDLSVNRRMNSGWMLMTGGTFGVSRSATRGGNRNDPHIVNNFDENPLTSTDRPWSLRASGSYELPYGIFMSGTFQLQAGAPETTTIQVTNQTISLPQGNQTVWFQPPGTVRDPNVVQLDLNIRKVWRFAAGKSITPRLQIFNVTNEATIDGRVTQLGPTYHRTSSIQRARLINMALDLTF